MSSVEIFAVVLFGVGGYLTVSHLLEWLTKKQQPDDASGVDSKQD